VLDKGVSYIYIFQYSVKETVFLQKKTGMTRIIKMFGARTLPIAPTGKEMQTLSTNNYISLFFYVCSTNTLAPDG
jgi:hypothetical protein